MLYVVATPIGNLQDITLRALDTLKTVEKIYCEDTRRTRVLLDVFGIKKPLQSFHQHSDYKIPSIIRELESGEEIAYVTDAGTPGINDPGGKLVEAAREAGIKVVPLPGASAITTLLSVSGIPADKFYFAGFIPTKKGRETFIKKILAIDVPVVFFETAPRLPKLLEQITGLGGASRELIVGRELTKQFEEIFRGNLVQVAEYFGATPIRGELSIILI